MTQTRIKLWAAVLVAPMLLMLAPPAGAANVAFIVENESLSNPGDVLVHDFLVEQGHSVQVIDQGTEGPDKLALVNTADIAIVSESVGSGNVANQLNASVTPIITAESFVYDDMGFTTGDNGVTQGQLRDLSTAIDIVNPAHPLAAGLAAGRVDIFAFAGFVGWGVPEGEVDIIATLPGEPDRAAFFVYDPGHVLGNGMTAPATRIGIPHNGLTLEPFPTWADAGRQLFAAAVNYAIDSLVAIPLQAGDADQDLDFDQLDLVKVQIGGKYLTGAAATWGDGDWNGAPGGTAGSPPAGNQRFDQFDVIAAQQAGVYLTGPYATSRETGSSTGVRKPLTVLYDAATGRLSIEPQPGLELTSLNIESTAGVFSGQAAANLGGAFDHDSDHHLFKATFGASFGQMSFGNVAQPHLTREFLLSDLTFAGSFSGGAPLEDIHLVHVPEPAGAATLMWALACSLWFGGLRRFPHAARKF